MARKYNTGFHTLSGLVKVDNNPSLFAAKIDIRRRVLAKCLPGHVFDGFAGTGKMHGAVWKNAASYVGCDLKYYPDDRLAYVTDSARLLRVLDLSAFTIFDFDAYGSPWDHVMIMSARRIAEPGERIGLVLTDGATVGAVLNSPPQSLLRLSGVKGGLSGYGRIYESMTRKAIEETASRMQCQVVSIWQAKGVTGQSMFYSGIVLQGIPAEARRSKERRPFRSS